MPIIQLPHVLALDTAILAVWAHRWRRGDVRAHRLVEGVLRSKARLIMTLHHVNELTGHESDDVVESRARFVRSLQQLFLVKSRNTAGIGGILDLHALEIRARLDDRNATFSELLSRVRLDAVAFDDSRGLSALMEEPAFVADSRERIRRRRIVASLSRTQVSMPEITQQRVDPRQRPVSLAAVLANFEREQQHLESQLRMVGDRDLAGPDRIAKEFFDELREHAIAATVDGDVKLADVLKRLGIEDVDLNGSVSGDLLGDKYVWKRRIRVLARVAGIPEDALEKLRPSDMPSTYLWNEMSLLRKGSSRAEGGDFDDASLSCLSFYSDLTTVDRRTSEAIRQVRSRRPELDRVMAPVVKVPTLDALERAMTSFE